MKALGLPVEEKKDFEVCLPCSYVRNCDTPGAGPVLTPKGIIRTKLVEVHKEMLHTKHQSSTPYSFREEEF